MRHEQDPYMTQPPSPHDTRLISVRSTSHPQKCGQESNLMPPSPTPRHTRQMQSNTTRSPIPASNPLPNPCLFQPKHGTRRSGHSVWGTCATGLCVNTSPTRRHRVCFRNFWGLGHWARKAGGGGAGSSRPCHVSPGLYAKSPCVLWELHPAIDHHLLDRLSLLTGWGT